MNRNPLAKYAKLLEERQRANAAREAEERTERASRARLAAEVLERQQISYANIQQRRLAKCQARAQVVLSQEMYAIFASMHARCLKDPLYKGRI